MADFTKVKLSESTNGRPILVVATATAGTLIHTASATAQDEVWLYASNSDAATKKLTIEYGGVTSPNDLIELPIPGEAGLVLVVPGSSPLTGGVAVRAFCETANVVSVQGFINRITA